MYEENFGNLIAIVTKVGINYTLRNNDKICEIVCTNLAKIRIISCDNFCLTFYFEVSNFWPIFQMSKFLSIVKYGYKKLAIWPQFLSFIYR